MVKIEKKSSDTSAKKTPASAPERGKFALLAIRFLSAAVMAILALGILLMGDPFIYIFALIIGTLLIWEWANMIPNKGHSLSYMVALATAIFISYDMLVIFAMLLAISIFVWFKSKAEAWRKLLTFGVLYISIGIGSVIWLYEMAGLELALWLLLVVWATDIGAYIVGSLVRGPKLAPKISPNKTWAGLLGGILFAAGVSQLFLVTILDVAGWQLLSSIAIAVAIVAQLGDLLESSIKRKLKIKDSSKLIPGHGGMLDRLDGLLFAAPFMCIVVILHQLLPLIGF